MTQGEMSLKKVVDSNFEVILEDSSDKGRNAMEAS